MAFTDMEDVEQELDDEGKPPEEQGNRTFIIVVGVLGAIMVLALVCMAVYAFFILPGQRTRREAANATAAAQSTQIAFAATQTAGAPPATRTSRPTVIPPTVAATSTPVLAQRATETPTEDASIAEATRSALLTQVAEAELTQIPTSTALPGTGFADEVGTTGLLAMAVVLVVVIFLVRRLRTA